MIITNKFQFAQIRKKDVSEEELRHANKLCTHNAISDQLTDGKIAMVDREEDGKAVNWILKTATPDTSEAQVEFKRAFEVDPHDAMDIKGD